MCDGHVSCHQDGALAWVWGGAFFDPLDPQEAIVVNTGKAIIAGLGARALTGSLIGFIVVFFLIYWLLGGTN